MAGRNILNAIFGGSLVIALGSSCLLGQPFFFRKDIPTAVNPLTVVVGDFNGDNRPDLAVTSWEGVLILLNEGAGNFGRPIRTNVNVDLLFVGDFNADGRDDLLTNRGLLLLSRGDGTFLPPRTVVDVATQGTIRAAGDLNGDGKPDLLVGGDVSIGSATDEGLRVWLGNGDGTFRPGELITSLRADVAKLSKPGVTDRVRQVALADFNRDGRTDLGILPVSNPLLPFMVLLGNGDGTFSAEVRTEMDSLGVLVADFNGDGLPDLATAGYAFCAKGTTGIALGKGDGSFESLIPYPFSLEGLPWPLAAEDFTRDSKTDLVTARMSGSDNIISIYPGKGDGTFLPPVEQAVGWAPHAAATVDLDGDGRRDLVIVNFGGSSTLSVLLARAEGGPALRRAVSAASDTAIVAPDSLATLFAPTTAIGSAYASPSWPTRLSGISLEVRDSAGAARLAPLLYVSPTQINFEVPAGTALGEAALNLIDDRGTSEVGSMQVDAVAPGLFMISSTSHSLPAATAVRVEPDGTQVPIAVFSCSGTLCQLEPVLLSTAGNRPIYVSFYGTGFRNASAGDVTCSLGAVVYAGPQGTPGLDQINVRVSSPDYLPDILQYGGGPVPVTIRINSIAANSTVIDLR
jgi:uncharacterized protein (TIGR03437 family)